MRKRRIVLLCAAFVFVVVSTVDAAAGCCSGHGGVCGCRCCDGKPLSAKCAPKYPGCAGDTAGVTATPEAPVGEFSGKVVAVADGDTITVLDGTTQVKIRLNGVDCPEKAQAFGQKAKQFTSSLVFGQNVTIRAKEKDRYGRTVADVVLADGRVLNHELVRAGFAWWYQKYAPNDMALKALEDEARAAKRGLWADPNPTPPWDFRRRK